MADGWVGVSNYKAQYAASVTSFSHGTADALQVAL
jgi:hypothetical protein